MNKHSDKISDTAKDKTASKKSQSKQAVKASSPKSKAVQKSEGQAASSKVQQSSRNEILKPDTELKLDSLENASLESLRPFKLEDFIGQEELKTRLSILLEAARQRNQTPDHILFAGPPGLGKTTLARIVANELDSELHITSGPVLERSGDVAAMMTRLQTGDVLFIDEVHRLARTVEEVLYPAMEEFRVDILLGKGPTARSISLDVAPFTLVAATTRTALITSPLRDRFGLAERLDYYTEEELRNIVIRAAKFMDIRIAPEAAEEISRRSRGTPRIANRLLKRVRDFAQIHAPDAFLDLSLAHEGLTTFGVDEIGLDKIDLEILSTVCEKFGGGPVGLNTLSVSVSEPSETVQDVYEPFLIQKGFLMRTPKGRIATKKCWQYLGLAPPSDAQISLDDI